MVTVFRKPCILPKVDITPRHCLTKQDYIDMLAKPRPECPPDIKNKKVLRRLKPISPRLKELAQPTRNRMLITLQEGASILPPALLDNLVRTVENETCLTPEQAATISRKKKLHRKKKGGGKDKWQYKEATKSKRSSVGVASTGSLDKDSVCCQYIMAERFVKSILKWKCSIPKTEFNDVAEVIVRRLVDLLEYTYPQNEDRKSQQLRYLADVIASWVTGVLLEVAQYQEEKLLIQCRKKAEELKAKEEEEESDEEDKEDKDKDEQRKKYEGEEDGEHDPDVYWKEEDEVEMVDEETGMEVEMEMEEPEAADDGGSVQEALEIEVDELGEEESEEMKLAVTMETEVQATPEAQVETEVQTQLDDKAEVKTEMEEMGETAEEIEKSIKSEIVEEQDAEYVGEEYAEGMEEGGVEAGLEEANMAEAKLAEAKVAEAKLAEAKLTEAKLAEAKLAEEKLAEAKLVEEKLAEEKLAEAKLVEEKLAEAKLVEEKLAEAKLTEAKLTEAKLAEEKLAEAKLVEAGLAEAAESQIGEAETPRTAALDDEVATEEPPSDEIKEEVEEKDLSKVELGLEKEISKEMEIMKGLEELLKTELPFLTFDKIIDTIYKMIESTPENTGEDPITNGIHRAIYDKLINIVMLEDADLLTEELKTIMNVVCGKMAKWLRSVLTKSQIAFMEQYVPEVESKEIRDWTKWLTYISDVANDWNVWLRSVIEQVFEMESEQITRGEWQDWTKSVDTKALLWRRFHLQTLHQAQRNATMMIGRRVVKTGTKGGIPGQSEQLINATDLQA